MTGRAQGKIALITGAASGLARASAILLAKEGAKLVLVDLNRDGLEATRREIGEAALAYPMDTTDPAAWDAVMTRTEEHFGGLNVLVLAAGVSLMKNIEQTSVEDWRRVHAINLDAYFYGAKAAIPVMRRSGSGSIVMVSSTSGLQGKPDLAAYCSSKGGVRLLALSVAMHCARDPEVKIRCNALFPGTIDTPMVRGSFGITDTKPASWAPITAKIPLGRVGEPNDIAYMVLYLASDESKYVTASEMVVDGGRTAA